MSLSVPNTGATAVAASRYAVITQDRLETSWNCRPMVGSAVATMVWSRAARNIVSIRLIRMVRTSLWVSGGFGAIGGASLISMTLAGMRDRSPATDSGNVCWSAGGRLCRSNLFMRTYGYWAARREAARNRRIGCNVGGRSRPRQRVARMGASRESTIAIAQFYQTSAGFSGLWPLFETCPLWQVRRPLHDMIFEVSVRDLALRSLHPPAHGNAGFVNRIGIARNKRVPPVEIAALRHELVAATRRQPVQGADVFRRQPDAVRNQLKPIRIVLAGAQSGIQELAGNVGEIDLAGVLVLKLFEAAPRTAVAQAFPFGAAHLLQRLGFPKESLLTRGRLGLDGHES